MSDEILEKLKKAWNPDKIKPVWEDAMKEMHAEVLNVVGIPPKMLTPTQIEANLSANLSTAYNIAGSIVPPIDVRARQMGRTAEMDRNYRGPQIIGNWRRRQARQERRKREAILRAKRAYAEAAKEVIASTVGMLGVAKKLFGGRR